MALFVEGPWLYWVCDLQLKEVSDLKIKDAIQNALQSTLYSTHFTVHFIVHTLMYTLYYTLNCTLCSMNLSARCIQCN